MMRGFGKKAILLLGAWALTGASGECIDTLDFIYKAENNLTDDSAVREYILCPETTFEVATKFESDGSPRYGQYPLLLARSNLHIRCGESGDSSNNCILQDGEQQVWFHDKFNPGKAITNVRLEGLTFTNEGTYTVMVDSFGELTLHDCIFKVRKNAFV